MRHAFREPFASDSVLTLCGSESGLCTLSVEFAIQRGELYTNIGYAPREYTMCSDFGLFGALDGEVV